MKVGLIYPSKSRRSTYSSSNPELQKFFDTNSYVPTFFLPSLALLTIAACSPPDVEVKLIDERVENIDFDEHFDIVGISVMTEQAVKGYEIAQNFRGRGIFTVMGGIHVSTLPAEAKRYCDCVVIGPINLFDHISLTVILRKGMQKKSITIMNLSILMNHRYLDTIL